MVGWRGIFGTRRAFLVQRDEFSDLTKKIESSVPEFSSIQSIGWNGQYWLIGGMGFLAMYNNSVFTDLTTRLRAILPLQVTQSKYSVNAVEWNGSSWMIGGGEAVALGHLVVTPGSPLTIRLVSST